jgi:hypothetical protein
MRKEMDRFKSRSLMFMSRGFIYGCLFGIGMASGRAKRFRYMSLGMGIGAGYAFQESM